MAGKSSKSAGRLLRRQRTARGLTAAAAGEREGGRRRREEGVAGGREAAIAERAERVRYTNYTTFKSRFLLHL